MKQFLHLMAVLWPFGRLSAPRCLGTSRCSAIGNRLLTLIRKFKRKQPDNPKKYDNSLTDKIGGKALGTGFHVCRTLRSAPHPLRGLAMVLSCMGMLGLSPVQAQNNGILDVKPLQIGDTIPEYFWYMPLQVVNHPEGKDTITLNDYRDKLIILDFWATWCMNCIHGMAELMAYQNTNEKEILMLPVTHEPKVHVDKFIATTAYKGLQSIRQQLVSVVEDTTLTKGFPKKTIPHTVLINGGKVFAITHHKYLNNSVIKDLLTGKSTYIPVKIDVGLGDRGPMLSLTSTDIPQYSPIYYNAIFGELDGISAGQGYWVDRSSNLAYLFAPNLTILELYAFAGLKYAGSPKRRILEVSQPHQYSHHIDNETGQSTLSDLEWKRKNRYSYESVQLGNIGKAKLLEQMKHSLDIRFGVQVRIEKRKIECLFLRLVDTVENSIFAAAGSDEMLVVKNVRQQRVPGNIPWKAANSGAITYARSKPMATIAYYLNYQFHRLYPNNPEALLPPVFEETGYSGKVDIDFPDEFEGIDGLRQTLRKQGLDLVSGVCEIDMFVLTENGVESEPYETLKLTPIGYVPITLTKTVNR